jgi:hypothetical protein
MVKDQSNYKVLTAPGSLPIFLFQFMAIVPFGTAIPLIMLPITTTSSVSFNDLLILSALIVLLLLIGVGMLYIPYTYKYRVCFDVQKNELKIKRKMFILNIIKIDSTTHIVAQKIKTNLGCRFKLIIRKNGTDVDTIFNEKTPFGTGKWESFADNLSSLVNIPVEKESLIEG